MSGGSDTPDPYATAAAQTQSNEQTAAYNAALNRTSEYTPYGNSIYSQTGVDSTGAPTWSNTINLTPEAQAQLDNQLKQNDQLSSIGFGLADQAQSSLANPISQNGSLSYGATSSAPIQTSINNGDYASQIKQAQDAAYNSATQYLDPQWAKADNDLNVTLANQGVQQGSAAYNQAQNLNSLAKNQAYNAAQDSAVSAGNALQQQLYGQQATNAAFANSAQGQQYSQSANNASLNNSAIAQQLQQNAYLNTLPLNELNALRSGTTIQNPTFTTAPSATAAGTNVAGNVYQSAQMNQASNNNFLNGLFSLGAAFA